MNLVNHFQVLLPQARRSGSIRSFAIGYPSEIGTMANLFRINYRSSGIHNYPAISPLFIGGEQSSKNEKEYDQSP